MRTILGFLFAYGAASLTTGFTAVLLIGVISFLPGGIRFEIAFLVPLAQHVLICAGAAGVLALAPSLFAIWWLGQHQRTWSVYGGAGATVGASVVAVLASVPQVFLLLSDWLAVPGPNDESLVALVAFLLFVAVIAGFCAGVMFWATARHGLVRAERSCGRNCA